MVAWPGLVRPGCLVLQRSALPADIVAPHGAIATGLCDLQGVGKLVAWTDALEHLWSAPAAHRYVCTNTMAASRCAMQQTQAEGGRGGSVKAGS